MNKDEELKYLNTEIIEKEELLKTLTSEKDRESCELRLQYLYIRKAYLEGKSHLDF